MLYSTELRVHRVGVISRIRRSVNARGTILDSCDRRLRPERFADTLGFLRTFRESKTLPATGGLYERFAAGESGREPHKICALKNIGPCCQGQGYKLVMAGGLIHANLCDCLRKCPSCVGTAVRSDGSVCQQPSPPRIAGLINHAEIPARYIDAELDRFSNESGNWFNVRECIRTWLANFSPQTTKKGLLLWGSIGIGKTYFLCCIAKAIARKGYSVKFMDFMQLTSKLRTMYSQKQPTGPLVESLMSCDLLVIDELARGKNTEFEWSFLDELIVGRYNRAGSMVIATNYRPYPDAQVETKRADVDLEASPNQNRNPVHPELSQKVRDRVFSRLIEMTEIIKMSEFKNFRDRQWQMRV